MKKILFTTCFLFSFIFIANSASALSLSPVRLELSGYPGDVLTGEMKLRNDEVGERTLYSHFENFDAAGETGSPRFLPGTSGLATWIDTSDSVALAEGEEKKAPFTITIPQDAKDGGYFSAVFWSVISPDAKNDSQVLIGAKVGTLILLRVGDVVVSGNGLKEFGTVDSDKFYTSIPVSFFYRFENGGSDRIKPAGNLVVKSMFGNDVATLNANPNDGNVLPGTIRKFDLLWEDKGVVKDSGFFGELKWQWNHFYIGSYSANITIDYGGDDLAMSTFNFFIVPWQLLLTCLVILILLFILIKFYNKWIAGRARRIA